MRFPLNIKIDRDERKQILFLGDLFTGTQDLLLTSLVKILGEEYYCMYEKLPKGPREAVRRIAHLCMSESLRPDLMSNSIRQIGRKAKYEKQKTCSNEKCHGTT